jgi:UDP-N-acetylmuramoyl-L-alanyl-D-glutamate--2,6-diaminopimelate ligase
LDKIVTPEQEIKINNCFSNNQGVGFEISGLSFSLSLLGRFNIYNALAAVCVGLSQNIRLETCQKALIDAQGVPGRMELVVSQPFYVFVDYAFTPNALEKVYRTIRKDWVRTKMICVLGACGGGRDKWKRPVLGRLAAQYCDEVVLTNEDPYDEDPQEIIDQIAKGTKGREKKIINRREAISSALKIAQPNDVVVITGKGCEPSICLAGGRRIPWDDRKVVKEEFNKIYS